MIKLVVILQLNDETLNFETLRFVCNKSTKQFIQSLNKFTDNRDIRDISCREIGLSDVSVRVALSGRNRREDTAIRLHRHKLVKTPTMNILELLAYISGKLPSF